MNCTTVRDEVHINAAHPAVQAHLAGCLACARYAQRFARLDQIVRGELVLDVPQPVSQQLQVIAYAPAATPSRLDAALRDQLMPAVPADLTERLQVLAARPTPLDQAVRDALVLDAPADLTARLQALIPQPVVAPAPQAVPPSRTRRWIVSTVYAVTTLLLLLSIAMAGQVYGVVLAQLGLEAWLAQLASLPGDLLTQLYTVIPQSRLVVGVVVWLQQPLQWLLVGLLLWAVLDMTQRPNMRHAEQPRRLA